MFNSKKKIIYSLFVHTFIFIRLFFSLFENNMNLISINHLTFHSIHFLSFSQRK